MVEPSCEVEVAMLLDWAINTNQASSYLRLVSLPWVLPFQLPATYTPQLGKGVALTEGNDVVIISYGPVMLSSAVKAAKELMSAHGISVKVINLPWLNEVDADWLSEALVGFTKVLSIDNHYLIGGQGDRIAEALLANGNNTKLRRLALNCIPICGTNPEILCEHGLDTTSIVQYVIREFQQ
jgi:transketolase